MFRDRNPLVLLAGLFAATFIVVVVLGYVPGVTNEQGLMLGLFRIDPIDDAVHLLSGLWAAWAAWRGPRQATFFFRWFGLLYFGDGLMGAIIGKGYLDGALVFGHEALDPATRFAANVPHMVLGGMAMLIGFWLARRWLPQE